MNRSGFSHKWFLMALVLTAESACEGRGRDPADSSGMSDLVIRGPVDTLLSGAPDSLSRPIALALAGDGTVFVLDGERLMVVAWSPSEPVRSFSRGGEGPGELRNPSSLDVAGDTVRVYNVGNGRLELFGLDGSRRGGRQLPPAALDGPLAVARDGRLAATTMGVGDSNLAILFASGDHHELMRLGELLSPPNDDWPLSKIYAATSAGEVPSMFRNFAQPVFGAGGDLWLILFAEGAVQRYDSTGRLVSSLTLDIPEVRQIKADFVEASRKMATPGRFVMLNLVIDATLVGEDLWLLLHLPEDSASVVLVVGADGRLRHRLVVPGVRGANAIAVNREQRELYLAVADEGLLLRTALPPGLP